MDVIYRKYRRLKRQSSIPHDVELGWHKDIGPNDSDVLKMYDKDHTTVFGFMNKYYQDSSADVIIVKGRIDREYALSKRVFVCETDAFRAKKKGFPRKFHG